MTFFQDSTDKQIFFIVANTKQQNLIYVTRLKEAKKRQEPEILFFYVSFASNLGSLVVIDFPIYMLFDNQALLG